MDVKKVVIDLRQIDQLEERITRAAELIGTLRRERDAARSELKEARRALTGLQEDVRRLEVDRQGAREAAAELEVLREERQAIRGRVSRMLEMMATLDESAAGARPEH